MVRGEAVLEGVDAKACLRLLSEVTSVDAVDVTRVSLGGGRGCRVLFRVDSSGCSAYDNAVSLYSSLASLAAAVLRSLAPGGKVTVSLGSLQTPTAAVMSARLYPRIEDSATLKLEHRGDEIVASVSVTPYDRPLVKLTLPADTGAIEACDVSLDAASMTMGVEHCPSCRGLIEGMIEAVRTNPEVARLPLVYAIASILYAISKCVKRRRG